MSERETALRNALRELTAMVRGECPSLLNEDSGGNGELSCEIDTLLASPLSAPPQEPTVAAQLIADDVEWVVNDNAELGVKIGRQFFFCYKGHSLVYDTGTHDDGTPMMWRPVFKREFGECIHPVNYANPTHIGTVSLADSDQWKPLPISPQEPTGAKRHSLTDWIPTEGCDCDQCTAAKMATLKSISGSSPCDDMGEGWFVTVGRFGASFVTLEETHLGGKPYFTPEDKALVRGSARHLLSFIGELEPTGASPQAEELRAANVANLREMVGMAGRHRETLLAVRECILALSPGHRTGYDWNADPLFLTLKEGRALNLIDDALKATPASPQAEPSRCAETCGLLRCRLNEGHSGLHQVYNAATGDFQQFIGQLAPVSPVEPTPEPETCECGWREVENDAAGGRYFEQAERPSRWAMRGQIGEWSGCPYCGKPLALVPAEGEE